MANKRSLLLNDGWDIALTNTGDIALTTGLYCDAQNVANKVRLFTKDAFLAQNEGIPHFSLELGHLPPPSAVRSAYRKAARKAENIVDAVADVAYVDRNVTGLITATTEAGETVTIEV